MLFKNTLSGCEIATSVTDRKNSMYVAAYYNPSKMTKWGLSLIDYKKMRSANIDCENEQAITEQGLKVYTLANNLLLVTVAYEENNAASMNLHFFYVTKEFKIERLSQQDLKSMKFTSVIPSPNGYNFLLVAEDSALLIS